MRQPLAAEHLPDGALLLTCSSHEGRCKGLLTRAVGWSPGEVVLFRYDDDNPVRDRKPAVDGISIVSAYRLRRVAGRSV